MIVKKTLPKLEEDPRYAAAREALRQAEADTARRADYTPLSLRRRDRRRSQHATPRRRGLVRGGYRPRARSRASVEAEHQDLARREANLAEEILIRLA
jgi:hypothetical protein